MGTETTPRPNIVLLGRPAVRPNVIASTGSVVITGKRAQVLAARLVLDRSYGGVTRDTLAETVWGERLPATWPSALRGLVSKVRRAFAVLGDSVDLTFDGTRYTLQMADTVTVDVEVALRVLSSPSSGPDGDQRTGAETGAGTDGWSSDHGATSELDPVTAWALETLQKPFLPEAEGDWVRTIQDQIILRRVEGLHDAAQRESTAGRAAAAVELARQAAHLSPLSDRSMRLYLQALLHGGHRDRAIAEFLTFQRRLHDDLGVSPEPDTQDVYLTALGQATDAPPGPHRGTVSTTLHGLDEPLNLARRLWDRTTRGRGGHLRITGEHGLGKSTFVHAALQALGNSCDSILVCDPWNGTGHESSLARALLRRSASGGQAGPAAPPHPGPDDSSLERWVMDQLCTLAASTPTLLLVDDLDQADGTTRRVLEILLATRRWPPRLMAISTTGLGRPVPPDPLWSHLPQASPWSRSLELNPWSVRVLRQYLEDRHGLAQTTHQLFEIHRRSGGNPFLAQLITTSFDDAEAQATASAHLRQRCQGLGPNASNLVKAMALAGPAAEHEVLAGMLGLSMPAVAAASSELKNLRLVEDIPLPAPSSTGIGLVHGIYREVVLGQISPSERGQLLDRLTVTVLHDTAGTAALYLRLILEELPAGHLRSCTETCPRAMVRCIRSTVATGEMADVIPLLRSLVEALPHLDDAGSLDLKIDLAHLLLEVEDHRATDLLLDTAGQALSSGDLPRAMEASQIMEECHRRWPDHFPSPGPVLDVVSQALRSYDADLDCFHAARFTASVLRHGDPDVPQYALDAALVVLTEKLNQQSRTPLTALYRAEIAEDLWAVATFLRDQTATEFAMRHGLAAACILNDPQMQHRFAVRMRGEHQHTEWAQRASHEWAAVRRFCQGSWQHDETGAIASRQNLIARWAHQGSGHGATAQLSTALPARSLPAADGPLDAHLRGGSEANRQQLRLLVASVPDALPDSAFHDLGALSLASTEIGDEATMEMLMDRMVPLADFSCGHGFQTTLGPVALHLGRMSRRLGRLRSAGEYLDFACAISARMQQPLWAGLSLRENAAVMESSGQGSARAVAGQLRRESDRLLAGAGLPGL